MSEETDEKAKETTPMHMIEEKPSKETIKIFYKAPNCFGSSLIPSILVYYVIPSKL